MLTGTSFAQDRKYHWLPLNHATRSPHRWVVMDSEAHRKKGSFGERQHYRMSVARRWHDERGKTAAMATQVFYSAEEMWQWIGEFTRPSRTTVLWCHNLDYDLQNTNAFLILARQGWRMEWCNLDEQVSMAKWTRDGCTLKMADTFAWIPKPLAVIGDMLGIGKPELPEQDDSREAWETRCVADVDITACLVAEIIHYVRSADLGNMQLSGAGMGYSMWRHRYLDHKVLVHADEGAIVGERSAMHTGRAEAWRHGEYRDRMLIEWDMSNAYTSIARDCDLPVQLIKTDFEPTWGRFFRWSDKWATLALVEVSTAVPCVPARDNGRELWPVGTFSTWLWDTEIALALSEGAHIRLVTVYAYLRAPAMRSWAEHTLDMIHGDHPEVPQVIKAWYKHQARATIGRCGMRYTQWQKIGPDWAGMTGLSTASRDGGNTVFRVLHVAGDAWEEKGKVESRDSVPMIPSWIAAECRVRLWEAMRACGLDNVYYVDTDSVITDITGHRRMREYAEKHPECGWRIKGRYRGGEIHGPRQIVMDGKPRIAGVPKKARRTGHSTFEGQVWTRMSSALTKGHLGTVRIDQRTWQLTWSDPRRRHVDDGRTVPLQLPTVGEYGADVRVEPVTS